jgi:SAM-dependent methyltransferase
MLTFQDTYADTYAILQPIMNEIVQVVQCVPLEKRPGTAHIDRMESLISYCYYVSLVRQWIRSPDAVLVDWGGQHGQVTKLLSEFFPNTLCYSLRADGYDQLYGLAEWHLRLGIKRVVWGNDPARISLGDCSADAVISSGVLEHTREMFSIAAVSEGEALVEIARVLRPGGLLFIWNLPRKWGREFLYPLLRRHAHECRYTRRQITELLRDAGFSISYLRCHELLPPPVLGMVARLGPLYWLLEIDYRLASLPVIRLLAQHFTIVARKG